ncbi:phage virion morphogenesis protein [Desulfatiglans anilini]|uniref:phage virion morphogenesis protein n=1 Tax=Desulfatiglans anilini TaxID=90728 RepID=UPI00054E2384|nr:phage virion morphogenesis protein [Desulfatiglans anilini]
MVNSTIEIRDEGVRSLLSEIQSRLQHLKPAMSLIGEIVQESIERNFEEGGRPEKWKDLSSSTKLQRQRIRKWPGMILVRSGKAGGLMGAISYRAFDDRVEMSANKEYAAVHQFGAKRGAFGTILAKVRSHMRRMANGKTVQVRAHTRKVVLPWGDIPARPFMMVQNEDWDEIRESLLDHLETARRQRRRGA